MKRILLPALGASLALLAACDDNGAPAPGANFSLTLASPGAAAVAKAAGADTLTAAGDTLMLTSVQIVLRKIELEADDDVEDAGDSTRVEECEAGPLLVDMPLGGGTDQVVSMALAPGTYHEVEFEIHAVSGDDAAEAAFRSAHPDFVGVSIRAQGTFNGTPFIYETDMDQEQESEINPPLVIDAAGGAANLTLRIDHTGWFGDGDGRLVDPSSANHGGPNESLVEQNIERSFATFEDDDHDGEEDD